MVATHTVFITNGLLVFNAVGELVEILPNPSDTWARHLAESLAVLLIPDQVVVNLGRI